MPYKVNKDLPHSVADHLPEHAQTIFCKAFNNAYKKYEDEVIAFKVAWAAVKKVYKKNEDDVWVVKK